MKKLIGALLLILAGSWLVSCALDDEGSEPRVQELRTGMVEGCEGTEGPAVSLMAEDEYNHLPLNGIKIRYRINGGNWRAEETVNELPYEINGPAGAYEFEIRKEGFPLRTLTVLVPQEGNCGIVQKELDLYLQRSSCSSEPPVIQMNVTTEPDHKERLNILLTPPNHIRDQIPCPNPLSCYFNIEANNPGDYKVEIMGFEDHKNLLVVDGVVQYAYADVTIEMNADNNQYKTIASEGVSKLTLTIPYQYGDSGCYEVDFNQVTVDREHNPTSDPNTIETMEKRGFRIEPFPSAACPENYANRPTTTVDYKVFLPAGTRLSDTRVEYLSEGNWETAVCQQIDGYTCSATYLNPFYGNQYQVRAVINDRILTGSNISLVDKCIIFN